MVSLPGTQRHDAHGDNFQCNNSSKLRSEQFSVRAHGHIHPMKILGLLGGVASGKSLVARQLAELGAVVLDADRAGHEALRLPRVEAAARRRWGDAVFGPDGHIDRSRLAKIVFAPPPDGPKERKYLEALTHPEIGRRLAAQAEALKAASTNRRTILIFVPHPYLRRRSPEARKPPPLAVLDAALILEAGWDKLCDCLRFYRCAARGAVGPGLATGVDGRGFRSPGGGTGILGLQARPCRCDY